MTDFVNLTIAKPCNRKTVGLILQKVFLFVRQMKTSKLRIVNNERGNVCTYRACLFEVLNGHD